MTKSAKYYVLFAWKDGKWCKKSSVGDKLYVERKHDELQDGGEFLYEGLRSVGLPDATQSSVNTALTKLNLIDSVNALDNPKIKLYSPESKRWAVSYKFFGIIHIASVMADTIAGARLKFFETRSDNCTIKAIRISTALDKDYLRGYHAVRTNPSR